MTMPLVGTKLEFPLQRITDTSTSWFTYIGESAENSSTDESKWRIKRVDETVVWIQAEFFPESTTTWKQSSWFEFVWDDRKDLTYPEYVAPLTILSSFFLPLNSGQQWPWSITYSKYIRSVTSVAFILAGTNTDAGWTVFPTNITWNVANFFCVAIPAQPAGTEVVVRTTVVDLLWNSATLDTGIYVLI